MRFQYEIDKCHCCGNRKPSMPGLQPAMLAVLAMSDTVQTSQLSEVAEDILDVLSALSCFTDSVGNPLQCFSNLLCQVA
jgi:hypothetical protein